MVLLADRTHAAGQTHVNTLVHKFTLNYTKGTN